MHIYSKILKSSVECISATICWTICFICHVEIHVHVRCLILLDILEIMDPTCFYANQYQFIYDAIGEGKKLRYSNIFSYPINSNIQYIIILNLNYCSLTWMRYHPNVVTEYFISVNFFRLLLLFQTKVNYK